MSTKALCAKPLRVRPALGAVGLLSALGGCAAPVESPGHSFAEVRLFRPPVSPQAPVAEALAAAPVPAQAKPGRGMQAAISAPVDPNAAAWRIDRLLDGGGFKVETRAEGAARLILATRVATPEALRGEATCALKAMRRPDFSASNLSVRVAPTADGVSVSATAHYVLIDLSLLSGELSRQTCRSTGALEAAVRRAALG